VLIDVASDVNLIDDKQIVRPGAQVQETSRDKRVSRLNSQPVMTLTSPSDNLPGSRLTDDLIDIHISHFPKSTVRPKRKYKSELEVLISESEQFCKRRISPNKTRSGRWYKR